MLPVGRRCPGAASGQSQVVLRKECIMRVSVTGTVGFTRSAIVRELPALSGEATLPLAAAKAGAHRGTPDESGAHAEIAAGLA
jgi:hypothetical protein